MSALLRWRTVVRIIASNVVILLVVAITIEVIMGRWFDARPGLAMLRLPRNVERTFDASAVYPDGAGKIYRRDRILTGWLWSPGRGLTGGRNRERRMIADREPS